MTREPSAPDKAAPPLCDVDALADVSDGWYAVVGDPSDEGGGAPSTLHEELTSPSIDCSCHATVWLELDHYFSDGPDETGSIDVSIDGGGWQRAYDASFATMGGTHVSVDLSSWAASQSDVRIRFQYETAGSMAFMWAIDNVILRP